MTIFKNEKGELFIIDNFTREKPFVIAKGSNGKNYVVNTTVSNEFLHIFSGNSKTGEKVINFNFSIEYTCDHRCECYKDAKCYAESGCYLFADNQAKYTENINFFKNATDKEMIAAIQLAIDTFQYDLFRYFTCGDIPNSRFFNIMVAVALANPGIKFWSYTKKYEIVNKWIDENGELPENLTIIFSHWLNEDGTYFPMNNRHNLPTSEFIPYGKEELKETVTHICPCSNPDVIATCSNCDHPFYDLKKGESMALLEHSTKATKERDKAIKAAKQALKK
jgi:hypothetical protein